MQFKIEKTSSNWFQILMKKLLSQLSMNQSHTAVLLLICLRWTRFVIHRCPWLHHISCWWRYIRTFVFANFCDSIPIVSLNYCNLIRSEKPRKKFLSTTKLRPLNCHQTKILLYRFLPVPIVCFLVLLLYFRYVRLSQFTLFLSFLAKIVTQCLVQMID